VIYLINKLSTKNVNRIILICIFIALLSFTTVYAADYPAHTRAFYVNDYANVLDESTERYIEDVAEQLEKATSAQVVVVTMEDLGDEALEQFSLGLFREWGIGDKTKNNGVLMLLDVGGRQSRIEVGYGLEGALTDGKTGRIQDEYMIPYFAQGDYSQGIREGFKVIVNEIYTEYGLEGSMVDEGQLAPPEPEAKPFPSMGAVIFIVVIIILIILDFRFSGGMVTLAILHAFLRGGRYGGGRGGGGGGGGYRGGGGGSTGGGGSSRGW
jgi:uncharacterized protein